MLLRFSTNLVKILGSLTKKKKVDIHIFADGGSTCLLAVTWLFFFVAPCMRTANLIIISLPVNCCSVSVEQTNHLDPNIEKSGDLQDKITC
jgi:hypothetical protein